MGARSVLLVGMSGAGKTALAPALARALDLPWADLDERVERAAGMPARSVFELLGEPAFRAMERAELGAALAGGPLVLAMGAGAPTYAPTQMVMRDAISGLGFGSGPSAPVRVLWVDAPDAEIARRLSTAPHGRPLLPSGGGIAAAVAAQRAAREALYREISHARVDTGPGASDPALRQALAALAR